MSSWIKLTASSFNSSYAPWTQRYNLLFTPFSWLRPLPWWELWLAESECGAVIARSAHSSLHLGVGLRILLATREISPFCSLSTATRPQSGILLLTCQIFPRYFRKILLTPFGLYIFPVNIFLCAKRERETRGGPAAKSFAFQQRGLWVFVRFFRGDRLSFFVGS